MSSPGAGGRAPDRAVVDAWQAALAAEHQAVFGYQLLGPRLAPAQQSLARRCESDHDVVRDDTATSIDAAGLTPVAPAADYPALDPVGDAVAARRLAVRLEDACAAAWRYLYLQAASATGAEASALRARAQGALTASAVRATRWRALDTPARATVAFPGL